MVGIAILVPIMLSAGVYWLHHVPPGSQRHAEGPLVEVRLVQEPAREPAPLVVTRPDIAISTGRPEPLVAAPERSIPEETTTMASVAPTTVPAESAPARSATARVSAMPSGSASAFRRQLLSHIARYKRHPNGGQADGVRGVVQVLFAMRRDGTVIETWVRTSSGHVLLDQAATETIRRAQPLPAIPADLPDKLTILLPMSFDAQ
ncbi:energy transducer TonB [Bradyrhizobium sp. LHD-71]|uniref:energy transducer TonB family protein n=1 Tax=Bradyrhizobium sp. LHD-71 TaxID=3072141 RepID=UPI00280CCF04|nr:energy transducer TonB [Bradyrhizobium sp. LHD-71]MDQ8728073.1 energy transducer TonB [Bradyrhizobium sp. LHD-71]